MIPLLAGVRVLELSAVVLGPYVGQILADLGAEVVRVEPVDGDIARAAQPQSRGMSALYVNNNRNKRSVALDLKAAAGKAALARLVGRSDVLFHNMRVAAAARLGVDFPSAAALNPRLVYCAAIGYGQGGRYRDRPAFDDVIQAASGLADLGRAAGGEPRYIPTILADKITALHAVYGMIAALFARERGREGPIEVEVPMLETVAAFLLNEHLSGATFGRDGALGYGRVMSRDRRPYRTRDGWIAVLPYTTEQWRSFLLEGGRADMVAEPWFADPVGRASRVDLMYAAMAEILLERTSAEWLAALERLDVPCSHVARLEDLLEDPHLADVGFFDVPEGWPSDIVRMLPQPVRVAGVEPAPDLPPPPLGADTRAVLSECGYAPDEIDALVAAGVAREAG
ncbi:MAG: CoA transferase [Alphaproteobacteria bacterium]|nr:CoA transferase [Alphaproteobacteria bacterium]